MTERLHLLPQNATPLERAVSESVDWLPELGLGADELHSFKLNTPLPSIVPWLVVEYGLGPITPYLPDLATVLDYGVRWQRVKGTPQGVAESLTWTGYAFDELYEAPTRRTRWHLFELDMDRFWDDESDLDTIEAVARMSGPVRSEFWRGYEGYNVRAHDWSHSRWGDGIWGDSSGVRLHDGGVKWSFGRAHEPSGGTHNFTEAELTSLGVWIEPVGASLTWGAYPWTTPGVKWSSDGAKARAQLIATGLLPKPCWIGVYRQDGSAIGYRKARAYHPVTPLLGGYYTAGGSQYVTADIAGSRLYVEALMDFGEGEGEQAQSWAVILGGALPVNAAAGTQWLAGDALVGGIVVGGFAINPSATFGKTSREKFRAILRIV